MSTWADGRSWVIAGPRPSRVEPEVAFLVSFFLTLVFFGIGIFPGFVFEMDGRMNAWSRCPPSAADLARGYDPGCVHEIVSRGPLALGSGALAISFVLGGAAIVAWTRVSRGRHPHAAAVIVTILYLGAWKAMLDWNAAEGVRLVRGGLGFVT